MSDDKRFDGALGEEYGLLKLALPYYDELECIIGEKIRLHCASNKQASPIDVVEGGCGTGLTTIQILEADSRIHIIAIDNEPTMQSQAQTFLKKAPGRVSFVSVDLLSRLRKMQSSSINIFASGYMIHNLTPAYRRALFAEIARVLKPSGLFVNGDKCVHDDPVVQAEDFCKMLASFDVFDTIDHSDYKSEWIKHYEEDEKVRFTELEQRTLLAGNGFSNIRLVTRFGMDSVMSAIKS